MTFHRTWPMRILVLTVIDIIGHRVFLPSTFCHHLVLLFLNWSLHPYVIVIPTEDMKIGYIWQHDTKWIRLSKPGLWNIWCRSVRGGDVLQPASSSEDLSGLDCIVMLLSRERGLFKHTWYAFETMSLFGSPTVRTYFYPRKIIQAVGYRVCWPRYINWSIMLGPVGLFIVMWTAGFQLLTFGMMQRAVMYMTIERKRSLSDERILVEERRSYVDATIVQWNMKCLMYSDNYLNPLKICILLTTSDIVYNLFQSYWLTITPLPDL